MGHGKNRSSRGGRETGALSSAPRRQFMANALWTATGASLARCFPDVGGRWPQERAECQPPDGPAIVERAPVAEVFNEGALETEPEIQIRDEAVAAMLGSALGALAPGVEKSLTALLPGYVPGMRIGIKVNCLNELCATSVSVVRALVAKLEADLSVRAEDIIVWDRRLDELTRSGFTESALGTRVMGTVNSTTDFSGPGYESDYCTVVEGKTTRLSRILTELTDLTINCPVLKTHAISGITGAMKNMYGVIDNPADFHDGINSMLPAICALRPIRERVQLHITDALIAVTTGGTSSPPDAIPKLILASTDPVAIDRRSLALVNELRTKLEVGLTEIAPTFLEWLDIATERGLGARNFDSVIRLG